MQKTTKDTSLTKNTSQAALMPVLYIPHGGGPLPLLGEENHQELVTFLKHIHNDMPQPKAILMISAHWESNIASISSSAQPTMIYDYGGFPVETYAYQYPAPGNPALAEQVAQLLSEHHIPCQLDAARGYDHGTFVPLMLMYPKADIPVVQVSLLRSLDPNAHIELGEALSALRAQGVLIVGSGMSVHNMRASQQDSLDFDDWLTSVLTHAESAQTRQALLQWAQAPSARQNHPREEHLLPLHICFGAAAAANKPAEKVFDTLLFDKKTSAFMWH